MEGRGRFSEGALNTNWSLLMDRNRRSDKLLSCLSRRFKQDFDEQAGFFGAYDAVNLFAAAMEKVLSLKPSAVRWKTFELQRDSYSMSTSRSLVNSTNHSLSAT